MLGIFSFLVKLFGVRLPYNGNFSGSGAPFTKNLTTKIEHKLYWNVHDLLSRKIFVKWVAGILLLYYLRKSTYDKFQEKLVLPDKNETVTKQL